MEYETPDIAQDLQMLQELAARNRTPQMRAILQRVMPQHPDHHDVLYYSAQVDWLEDKDEDALATVSQLVERYPESYWGRMLLFRILDGLNRRSEAETVILEMLREYPEDALLYGRYSILMLESMRIEKAGELAARAIAIDPDDEIALTASILHELLADPGEPAKQRLAELVSRYPDAVSTALMVVAVLSEQDQNKEALHIAQEVLRQSPDSQGVVDLVISLKTANHWSMVPLRPLQKWGWGASIAIWFVMIMLLRNVEGTPIEPYALPIIIAFIAYAVYSWVWPPILKWWMRR
jgi:predicted Zn-dependent protease